MSFFNCFFSVEAWSLRLNHVINHKDWKQHIRLAHYPLVQTAPQNVYVSVAHCSITHKLHNAKRHSFCAITYAQALPLFLSLPLSLPFSLLLSPFSLSLSLSLSRPLNHYSQLATRYITKYRRIYKLIIHSDYVTASNIVNFRAGLISSRTELIGRTDCAQIG